MSKENEIREHLENGVLKTEPGTRENDIAVKALNDFNRTFSEVTLREKEVHLKEDEANNRLLDKRDDNELKARELEQREKKDWIDMIFKGATIILNTLLCAVVIHNDTTGKPLLSGPGRQVVGNLFRKH